MKIRTDFVTNSSSSCYVTIVVETKDGKHYLGEFEEENGYMSGGITEKEFTLKNALHAENGKALIEFINAAYNNLFGEHGVLDTLFETDDSSRSLDWPIGRQKELEVTPMSEILSVSINDYADDDDGGATEGELVANFATCEEQFSKRMSWYDDSGYEEREDEDFDKEHEEGINEDDDYYKEIRRDYEYKEIRKWKTGEVRILKDEEKVIELKDEENVVEDEEDEYEE